MAEQIPGSSEQTYNPSMTDWRVLVALKPDYGQDLTAGHGPILQASLETSALSLMGTSVETHVESDALLVSFYLGDMNSDSAVQTSVSDVYRALHTAGMGDMRFLAMQLGRQLEVAVFGEEYFAGDQCSVGDPAYELYREHVAAYEALSSQEQ